MSDSEGSDRRREFLDRCFEHLKHMATLSTAAALLILAIYREQPFKLVLLAVTLAVLGICLLVSVYGMQAIALDSRPRSQRVSQQKRDTFIAALTSASGILFIAAAVTLGLFLFGVPQRIALPVFGAAAVVLALLWRRQTHKHRQRQHTERAGE